MGSTRPNTSKSTGKRNVLTHFVQDPDCKLTKTTRSLCSNRPEARGDGARRPAIKADRKVLNEEDESCLQHRHAVVVQDLYSQQIQELTNEKQKLRKKR